MKYLMLFALYILTIPGYTNAQNCPPNIDFEQGNFSNWQCYIGTVDTLNLANVITLNPSPPTSTRHEILDVATAGNDPYGNFPRVCPYGGTYSVKLGNSNTGRQAEGISYTFQIPALADTFSLTYYYAVVFEDPGHDIIEQPRFSVSAYDVLTGNVIDCAAYDYVSNGSIPGFLVSPVSSDVLYKEWTPASIDFSGLAGRTVRLEFKTADCTRGGHFGYGYLDVGAGCGGVLAVGAYCPATNNVVLNAPYGFQGYTWYNNNYTVVLGNTRAITLSPPPPLNSLFHVDMVPYPGYGCRDTADATVTVLPVPDTPVAVTNVYYCLAASATTLHATANNNNEILWYTVAVGGTPSTIAPTPSTATSGSVDYWVSQRSLFGCEGPRKKITVTVSSPPLMSYTISQAQQCLIGNSFTFTNTSTNILPGSTCQWDFGDGQSSASCIATHTYTAAGQYTVTLTVTNPPGCTKLLTRNVKVIEAPLAAFDFPAVICENQTPIVLQDNSTVPGGLSTINTWWWQIGSNTTSTQNPPSFLSNGGQITVKLAVKTVEGCPSDTSTRVITVHYSPIPAFSFGPLLCNNETIKFKDLTTLPGGISGDQVTTWNWWYDNIPSTTIHEPAEMFSAGTHHIKLIAGTNQGCNLKIADSIIVIHPKPLISLKISDSCVFRNIVYTAGNDPAVPVDKWLWDFGNGPKAGSITMAKNFYVEGSNPLTLFGKTVNGCKDTLVRPFMIYYNRSKAERDTVVAKNEPLQLLTSSDKNMLWYKWSPAFGLNNTSISNPVAIHDLDQVYELNTMTKQGCDSYSKILVKRYKGPELYVPTAFTPNGDGINDKLKVFPVGIKSFGYFKVFNRDGALIFSTTNYFIGWDGTYKGAGLDPSNYVWVAMAVDYKGNVLLRRGNVLLLK